MKPRRSSSSSCRRGKVNQERDYVAKRAEYREIGVREYWVIDRFRRTLTVFTFSGENDQERVIPENRTTRPPCSPVSSSRWPGC